MVPSIRALTMLLPVALESLRPTPTRPPLCPPAVARAFTVEFDVIVMVLRAFSVASLSTKASSVGVSVAVAFAPLDAISPPTAA